VTKEQHADLIKQLSQVSRALRGLRQCLEPVGDLADHLLANIDQLTEETRGR